MTFAEVMAELEAKGSETTKRTLVKHGAKEPFWGTKIGDMKPMVKKIKKNHALALELYETGISDAMYFAALICDPKAMTKAQLNKWVKAATWHMLSSYAVAWPAAESPHARELALEWIESKKEQIANAGWCTYSGLVALKPDDQLDLKEIAGLMKRIEKEIHGTMNRVKYSMNGFLIAVGSYIPSLTAAAKAISKAIGPVVVDMGDTSCEVPDAVAYIDKVINAGKHGIKKKTVFC